MKNRFKFRVWDKQNECYAYSNNSDVDVLYIETDGELTYGVWDENEEDMFYTSESEVIVEQCTGLKDKNGKLIFEGDIVRSNEYPFMSDDIYNYSAEICWSDESAQFFYYTFKNKDSKVAGMSTGNTGSLDEYEWEVIGNIHENADLLEV